MHGTCANERVDRSFGLVREEGVTGSGCRVADASHGCVLCLVRSRQACAGHPTYAGYEAYSNFTAYTVYTSLSQIASSCGHPASTVTVTPPALDTCEGAMVKFSALSSETCRREKQQVRCGSGASDSECMHCTSSDPASCNSEHCQWNEAATAKADGSNVYDGQVQKCEPTQTEGHPEEHTPASCGHAECAELISSIDDDALAKMKTGLQVCA